MCSAQQQSQSCSHPISAPTIWAFQTICSVFLCWERYRLFSSVCSAPRLRPSGCEPLMGLRSALPDSCPRWQLAPCVAPLEQLSTCFPAGSSGFQSTRSGLRGDRFPAGEIWHLRRAVVVADHWARELTLGAPPSDRYSTAVGIQTPTVAHCCHGTAQPTSSGAEQIGWRWRPLSEIADKVLIEQLPNLQGSTGCIVRSPHVYKERWEFKTII